MDGRRLAKNVMLTDPTTGAGVILRRGSVPAAHLAALIGNPSAWEPEAEPLAPGLPLQLEGKSVKDVNAWLEEHPEHVVAVLAAEAAGENRKGIVDGPHAHKAEEPPA